MTREQQLAQQALDNLRLTTIGYKEYLRRKKSDPKYNWKGSHWGRAMDALVRLAAPPPSPPLPSQLLAQNMLLLTDNTIEGLESPQHWKLVVSADPNPNLRAWETNGFLAAAREQGRTVGVWGDCDGTRPDVIKSLQQHYGFSFWVGQAESNFQAEIALDAGAPFIVINAANLAQPVKDELTNRINAGKLSCTQECYANEGWPWPATTSAGGVPVHSLCIGLYAGSRGYISVADYLLHGADGAICAYYSGSHPGELKKLP